MNYLSLICACCVLTFTVRNAISDESGPTRGVISRLGENLEQETRLEDRLVEVLNQQEIKENLDSVGHYVGVIGTGLSAGLGTILGNTEQVIKSLQKK
ncbi:uncharacterized protein NPIL_613071 [Nephila pilipes]|uniref:Uncharacterized protein n=1 Tax=Nephila pilipes TaxID=299642 RepID=A0A8X6QUB3_NEPPI|nr:uncharacterized protein NPIL_613071 [Nephila pilipes]